MPAVVTASSAAVVVKILKEVEPKIGVDFNPPKWMVKISWFQPYFSMDDLGIPLFWETPKKKGPFL